jgi:hypothetical protein
MTPGVLDRPASLCDATTQGAAERFARPPADGHGATLEERLDAALREARTTGRAECPVCDAGMISTRAGAQCAGCGARLS